MVNASAFLFPQETHRSILQKMDTGRPGQRRLWVLDAMTKGTDGVQSNAFKAIDAIEKIAVLSKGGVAHRVCGPMGLAGHALRRIGDAEKIVPSATESAPLSFGHWPPSLRGVDVARIAEFALCRSQSGDGAQRRARRALAQDAARPFDRRRGPLWRPVPGCAPQARPGLQAYRSAHSRPNQERSLP